MSREVWSALSQRAPIPNERPGRAPPAARHRRLRHLPRRLRPDRHREVGHPHRRSPGWCRIGTGARDQRRRSGLLLRGDRRRLERRLPTPRHDDHRQRHARDRDLRVPCDLGGQTGPRSALPADGAADPHHRGGLSAAGQRHHRPADRAGHHPAVQAVGPARGALPAGGGVRLEHRRHRHPGRRPAEHHHRQPRRPVIQRLPGPPGSGRRRPGRRPDRAVPLAVRRRVPHRRGTGRRDPRAQRAGGHQGSPPAGAVAGGARPRASRVRAQPGTRLRSHRSWRCSAPDC